MAVREVRYLIQTIGTDPVYLYKDSDKRSSHNTVINPNYMVIATKVSENGNWYYLPSKDMWISSSKVKVITDTPNATLSDKLTYKVAGTDAAATPYVTIIKKETTTPVEDTSKNITVNDADDNNKKTIDTKTNTEVEKPSTTQTTPSITTPTDRQVSNPTWTQPLTTEDTDNNVGKVPDLKKTGPKDVNGSGGILSGALSSAGGTASKYLTGQYSSFAKVDFNGVLGMPYQFMSSVDRRVSGNSIADGLGRKYCEKILTRNNLVYFTPCIQDLLNGVSELDQYGRYYTTKLAFNEYIQYVNDICKAIAIYMGIGNSTVTIGGSRTKLSNVNWKNAANSNFQKYIGVTSTIVAYADSLNSMSDDFSNDSQESQLASTVNGVSDTAKEINFIAKGAVSDKADMVMNALSSVGNGVSDIGGGGVISAIAKNTRTILSGGKLSFPELWGDSSHDTSYSINFKFRTPDCDPVSIFLNIIVPFVHLMCLTAPHDFAETEQESNGYHEPFLVRATFKGLFSVDYGMISSMSCDRGSEGTWTVDGLPTQMDVSMTIKDLYKHFYISMAQSAGTETGSPARFVGNDGLTDYLMCLSGVPMHKPVIDYKAQAYAAFIGQNVNVFKQIARLGTRFQTDLGRVLDNIFK